MHSVLYIYIYNVYVCMYVCMYVYMNIVHTNKYNQKLQSPGALNIQEAPRYKQKENVIKLC